MYIIAVTGGIACGKTVVSSEIKKFGAELISADAIAHELSAPGQPIYNAYVKHFGTDILDSDRNLDRRAIAGIVFNNIEERRWIDETTHPILLNRVRERLVECQAQGFPIAVLDVPLLFEAGWEYLADEVWVVCLTKARQLRRLMFRNNLSRKEASARINAQMDLWEKRRRADFVILNNKTRSRLKGFIQHVMNRKFPHLTRNPSLLDEFRELALLRAEFARAEFEQQHGEDWVGIEDYQDEQQSSWKGQFSLRKNQQKAFRGGDAEIQGFFDEDDD